MIWVYEFGKSGSILLDILETHSLDNSERKKLLNAPLRVVQTNLRELIWDHLSTFTSKYKLKEFTKFSFLTQRSYFRHSGIYNYAHYYYLSI